MSRTISSVAIEEKNKLARESVFLILAEITIPGIETPVRVARNTEDVTWRGHTWQKFPFEVEEIVTTAKNEIPRVDLKIGNVNRAIEPYLEQYDTYIKANGAHRVVVSIFVVNSLNLASETPEVEYKFHLKQPRATAYWAIFSLGAINTFTRRCPQGRLLRNFCRFVFKEERCGYTGAETTCDKTLSRCRELSNSARFGGFPGAGFGGLNVS